MPDDAELLQRYAQVADEAAFAELVRRHLGLVYQAALRRLDGNAALAEETAQEIFVALARAAHRWQDGAVLAGWLYVATRHAAANTRRRETRRRRREEAVSRLPADPDAAADSEWAQLRPQLDEVMDELATADRDAVLLRFFEQRSYGEIGAALRVSEDAARVRVGRALDKLRLALGRRGITSTGAALGTLLAAQSATAAPVGLAGTVTAAAVAGGKLAATAGVALFMAANKLAVGAVGAAILLGGVAWYESAEARRQGERAGQLQGAITVLRQEVAAQARRLQEAEQGATEARNRAAQAERARAEALAVAALAKPAEKGAELRRSVPLVGPNRMATLLANPDYYRLQLEIYARTLGLTYGPLYRRLGWSAEKIRAFEALMLKQQQNSLDVWAAAGANGVALENPAMKAQWSDPTLKAISDEIDALVGPQDLAAYRAFGDARGHTARIPLQLLAGNLYYTDSQLTRQQAEQLEQVIVDATPKVAPVNGILTPAKPDWTTIYAQAAAILTPEQLATLRATNERNELFLQANALERQILEGGGAPRN